MGVRKYAMIWFLAILSYLFTFGTPLIASYFMFAKPLDASMGGAFFYLTVASVALVLMIKLFSVVHKMKIGYAKVIISLLFVTVFTMTSKAFFEVVGNNFHELVTFVLIWYAGYLLGIVPKVIAIRIDTTYLREVGILG